MWLMRLKLDCMGTSSAYRLWTDKRLGEICNKGSEKFRAGGVCKGYQPAVHPTNVGYGASCLCRSFMPCGSFWEVLFFIFPARDRKPWCSSFISWDRRGLPYGTIGTMR